MVWADLGWLPQNPSFLYPLPCFSFSFPVNIFGRMITNLYIPHKSPDVSPLCCITHRSPAGDDAG